MLAIKKHYAAAVFLTAAVAAVIFFANNQGISRFFRREVLISVAGDILLDRGVAEAVEKNGSAYPFENVSEIFLQDDITIANLEGPLTFAKGGAMKSRKFVFQADPIMAQIMKSAGFDVLTLANNHTMDYLSGGLSDTMGALSNAGILYAGAGQSSERITPCFIRKNGINIGILSYSSLPAEGFVYNGKSTTIAYARAGFLDGMQNEISEAAAQCDFLFVFFHWGTEFRHDAGDSQKEIAHAAIDSGAAAIIGTHPHVLQGKEIYKGAVIYYSIGNFVFDSQIPEGTDEALILQLTIGKKGLSAAKEIPVIINDCQPGPAAGQKAVQILEDLAGYSADLER